MASQAEARKAIYLVTSNLHNLQDIEVGFPPLEVQAVQLLSPFTSYFSRAKPEGKVRVRKEANYPPSTTNQPKVSTNDFTVGSPPFMQLKLKKTQKQEILEEKKRQIISNFWGARNVIDKTTYTRSPPKHRRNKKNSHTSINGESQLLNPTLLKNSKKEQPLILGRGILLDERANFNIGDRSDSRIDFKNNVENNFKLNKL